MQKADSPQGKWQNAIFFLTALLIVATDQLSKIWIRSNLPFGQSLFEAGFFRLTHVHNTGAAFGLFQGQSFLLSIVAVVGITVFLVYALVIYRSFPFLDNMLNRVALGLILGGTAGNLIDRLCLGYVTDFIDFNLWPTFNIADSAVTVGVILFLFFIAARIGKH